MFIITESNIQIAIMKFTKQFLSKVFIPALAATMLLGCASPPPAPTLRLIFAKANEAGCLAAFDAGEQLVLVSRERRGEGFPYVTIYNRTNGLFFSKMLLESTPLGDTCTKQNPVNLLDGIRTVDIALLSNSAARKVFDDRNGPPAALESLITAGPPYFRRDSNYEGAEMNSGLSDMRNVKVNGSAFNVLGQFDAATIAAKAEAARALLAKNLAEINKESARFDAAYKAAQAIWNNRNSANYKVGDSVCTSSNFVGNIEEIAQDKFKVFVIGRVSSVQALFYSGIKNSSLPFEKVDAPRWFNKSDVAHCNFSL